MEVRFPNDSGMVPVRWLEDRNLNPHYQNRAAHRNERTEPPGSRGDRVSASCHTLAPSAPRRALAGTRGGGRALPP